jgi:hypothetical protein
MKPNVAISVKFPTFYKTEMFTGVMVAIEVVIFNEESTRLQCDAMSLSESNSQDMKGHSFFEKLRTTRLTTKRPPQMN